MKTQAPIIVGVDLAAIPLNPTGLATLKGKVVLAFHLFSDKEIIRKIRECKATLIAIDAPLSPPKNKEFMRKADREMLKRGYPVFPPSFRTMKKLTMRAMKLTQKIGSGGFDVIEVHPTSTRKALRMPTKDWPQIQKIFVNMGFDGDTKTRTLTSHEVDAATAVLTGYLHLKQKTELIGDTIEGYIVVPTESDWRLLEL